MEIAIKRKQERDWVSGGESVSERILKLSNHATLAILARIAYSLSSPLLFFFLIRIGSGKKKKVEKAAPAAGLSLMALGRRVP